MTEAKTCPQCGVTFERRPGTQGIKRFAAQIYCSRACSGLNTGGVMAISPEQRANLIEDLEWIIGTDHPARVAQRLGFATPESLIRRLQRWGYDDLSAQLGVSSEGGV